MIWGFAFVAQRIGGNHVGHFTFQSVRSWLAFFFLIGLDQFLEKEKYKTTKKEWEAGLICGFFLFLACSFQQVGVGYTSSAKAGFITALYVVLVPMICLLRGEKLSRNLLVSILMVTIGLGLLSIKGKMQLEYGDILMMICALMFSFQILSINHYSQDVRAIRLTIIQFLVTAVLSSVVMFVFEEPDIVAIKEAAVPILYAGILSNGVAYTFQVISQKQLEPTVASLVMCLESVFAALGGWMLLNQTLSIKELIGCILMLGGLILSQLNINTEA